MPGSLSFASPGLLALCACALLPLIVHLLGRRARRPIPFAALAFLMRSQARTSRALRLRKILIFCARTLLLAAIPLALAQPFLTEGGKNPAAQSGPTATVIAVDTSLSMRAVDARGEDSAAAAQKLALRYLQSLPSGDPAAVLSCDPDSTAPESFSFDRAASEEALRSLSPGWKHQSLDDCLARAGSLLEKSALPAKRVVLASDFAQTAFHTSGEALSAGVPPDTEWVLLDAALPAVEAVNAAVTSLAVTPIPSHGGRAFRFSATIRNFSDVPVRDGTLSLRIGQETAAKSFFDLEPGGTAVRTLTHRFAAPGDYSGQVSIGPDALEADNTFFFTLGVPRKPTVLIVNGSPSADRLQDEAFFVQAALDAPMGGIQASQCDSLSTRLDDLKNFDALFLLNLSAAGVTDEEAEAVREFVRGGGGLFLSLGDRIDADAFNARWGSLSPRQLRLVKTSVPPQPHAAPASSGSSGNPGKRSRQAARLAHIDVSHPALDVFAREDGEGLRTARFFRYFLTENVQSANTQGSAAPEDADSTGGRILAAFEDGAPAFIAGNFGKGRVLLFTSSVDRSWTDFPIRTGFLPLMQRVAAFLARSLEDLHPAPVRTGEALTFPASAAMQAREVILPDGTKMPLAPTPAASQDADKAGSRLEDAPMPGIYLALGEAIGQAVALDDGRDEGLLPGQQSGQRPNVNDSGAGAAKHAAAMRLPGLDAAVNVDVRESDLRKMPADALQRLLGDGKVTRLSSRNSRGMSSDVSGLPPSAILLLIAFLCFAAECLLMKR